MHIRRTIGLGALALALVGVTTAQAQLQRAPRPSFSKVELSGYVGYQFTLSTLSTVSGNLDLTDDVNYGGSIGIRIKPRQLIEFTYNRFDTDLRLRPFNPANPPTLTPIAVSNFYLGGWNEVHKNNLRPFFGFGLGATWFQPKSGNLSDDWRFSVMLGGGLKVMFGERQRVGLRLGANFLMTFLSSSWGGYCGTGGCGLGLFGSGVADLNFTAGLVVGLGDF